jgi:alpha-ketoglutarate-dependent taurine dioxygenase
MDPLPPPRLRSGSGTASRTQFDHQRLLSEAEFLDHDSLQRLVGECLAARQHAERSLIPGHKKGGTLSYAAIHEHAPACLALYHGEALRQWLGQVIGTPVYPTADHDQSSCSILYYDVAGDHIGWHFDHNFYRGRHFTVLLSLVNQSLQPDCGLAHGLSAGRLQRRRNGSEETVPTPPNTLVLFEGARVRHRATAVDRDQERIMLSMTFSTEPRVAPWKEWIRRLKDTAYFGPRVLFD